MRSIAIIVGSAMFLACSPALAQDSAPETDRYTLEKSADGYVRMDRQTGEMSICAERSGQLVCKVAADERSAFQDEAERLQADLKALEERVAKLESGLTATLDSALPTEEEFEKTMSFMESFLRRFIGIAKDLESEPDAPEPQSSDPHKT